MKRKHKPESKRRKTTWKRPEFPERYLEQLREAGLFVTECGRNHVIIKPKTTPGNSLPDYEYEPPVLPADCIGPSIPPSDAPHTYLWHEAGKWYVSEEGPYIPGPSPGRAYGTPAEAVADLLDYYFGDPARMQEWARLQTPEGRLAAYDAEYARNPKRDLCCVRGCVERRVGLTTFCQRHTKPMWWERYKL